MGVLINIGVLIIFMGINIRTHYTNQNFYRGITQTYPGYIHNNTKTHRKIIMTLAPRLTVDHLLTTVSLSLTMCNVVFLIQYSLKQNTNKKKHF